MDRAAETVAAVIREAMQQAGIPDGPYADDEIRSLARFDGDVVIVGPFRNGLNLSIRLI